MSDDFEDLLKRWLRDRGATDRSAFEAMAGHVAVLPPRRARQVGPLAAAAAVVVAIGLAAFALAPPFGSVSSQPSSPVPPDPAAFAGDPRLGRCANAHVEEAIDVFEMTHARDYHGYLPAMLLAPELDVDAPAFVVVFRDPFWYMKIRGGLPLRKDAPEPARQSPEPMHHDLCVLVGADPATAEMNAYENVDITGLTAILPAGADTSPIPPTPAIASGSAPSTPSGPTPTPYPPWAGDASAALACSGAPRWFARDQLPNLDGLRAESAGSAIHSFVEQIRVSDVDFPVVGIVMRTTIDDAALATLEVDGAAKAAVVVRQSGVGPQVPWVVTSVAACAASELDLTTPTGRHPIGVWTDATGTEVPASILSGTADCYRGTQVRFEGGLYMRSPNEELNPEAVESTWAADVPVPISASPTAYQSGDLRLFLGLEGRTIYIGSTGHAERLPHVRGDAYVRGDCN